ncbi:hypothetical protein KDX38_11880 [Pseudomonas sp. CDFA 602]|uniref:hypothetical protein n=1 Tax=Pseudomonas californiensis TaxID=2829823 RepID=UPI001E489006|nr:hypothetical protein [Pseudomonas californiensis]MCD5994376.1 hypothetical protein [Pseudomonas californiensis]MCD5999916.1 hypothetical protein [Pseudomonas californiensis]
MGDKELYEIEYTLLGEHHVDVIEDLDVPIIEIVHELAHKHQVELDDGLHSDTGLPHAAGITDVSIHSVEVGESSATA